MHPGAIKAEPTSWMTYDRQFDLVCRFEFAGERVRQLLRQSLFGLLS